MVFINHKFKVQRDIWLISFWSFFYWGLCYERTVVIYPCFSIATLNVQTYRIYDEISMLIFGLNQICISLFKVLFLFSMPNINVWLELLQGYANLCVKIRDLKFKTWNKYYFLIVKDNIGFIKSWHPTVIRFIKNHYPMTCELGVICFTRKA